MCPSTPNRPMSHFSLGAKKHFKLMSEIKYCPRVVFIQYHSKPNDVGWLFSWLTQLHSFCCNITLFFISRVFKNLKVKPTLVCLSSRTVIFGGGDPKASASEKEL